MPDSAERRAQRKLLAGLYNNLPTREVLQAAADLERNKAQRASQNEQTALQKGSFAIAILSQIPRDDEHNKPLFVDARTLLQGILKKGIAQLEEPEPPTHKEDEDEESAS